LRLTALQQRDNSVNIPLHSKHRNGIGTVGFKVPLDTLQAISDEVFSVKQKCLLVYHPKSKFTSGTVQSAI